VTAKAVPRQAALRQGERPFFQYRRGRAFPPNSAFTGAPERAVLGEQKDCGGSEDRSSGARAAATRE
jgi:hypothetical protein